MYDPVATGSGQTPTFKEPEQIKNAQTIIGVGLARKLSIRDIKIALMVAMQESNLRNLPYGDRDSLGLFQQRPSQGWGTAEQILDPVYASNKFYAALEKVKNRNSMSLFEVAVAVQRPNRAAYAATWSRWDAPASAFLVGVKSDTVIAVDVTSIGGGCGEIMGDVEAAVQAALTQVGKPYRWQSLHATKPFDDAELMQWAYTQAATTLPRNAAAQLKAGPAVAKPSTPSAAEWQKVLKRGDLLFWSDLFGRTDHVSMYLGNNQMVDTPTQSANVAVVDVPWTGALAKELVGATRPIDNMGGGGAHSGWQWPLKSTTVTSPYGMRYHPVLHVWRLHNGVDFAAPLGTPVYAARTGVVSFVGPQGGGGNVITIDHGGGIKTSYLHLSSFTDTRVGEKVSAGQRIALSGSTGYSTGPHLHFIVEIRGNTTNPITYLRQFGLVP
jgi:murein DD-endopeptidase MepM/ murein hydrolase activator NlpD